MATYEECYMRELIIEVLKWKDLCLADKPDLMTKDCSLGVEIAACIPEEQRKAGSLYEREHNGCLSFTDKLWLYHYHNEIVEKLKADNDNYIDIIDKRVIKKIEKHKNYVQTNEFGLALFTLYNGNIEDGVARYREIFMKHTDELDFMILDIANHSSLVYICEPHYFVVNYSAKQCDIVMRAYHVYQQELEKFD
jgi:hypothetical protein